MASARERNGASSARNSPRKNSDPRKAQIFAIILLVAAVLIFLSIVLYSGEDEALLDHISGLDILRLPFDETVKATAAHIHNPLGLIGAVTAGFMVEDTLGYFSLVLPVIMLLWGWVILRKKDAEKPLIFTNYALVLALLLSTAFGVANQAYSSVGKEWNGLMGAFIADMMIKLFGVIGSSILVLSALSLTIVLAIDLDIHKTLDRVSQMWENLNDWYARRKEEREANTEESSARKSKGEITIRSADEEESDVPPEVVPPKEATEFLFRKPIPEPELEPEQEADNEPVDEIEESAEEDRPQRAAKSDESETPEKPAALDVPIIEYEQEEITDYVFPSVELLDSPPVIDGVDEAELKANAELVKAKLANFGIEIESVSVTPGPVITLYELVPASGVKISRIVSLADDLALALAAKGIRIIAPIPGKSAVGVEIPNRNPSIVPLRSVLNSTKFREAKGGLVIALGKTIAGEVFVDDLTKMPHLLIAGSTGSGKSVGINTILASLVYRLHPSDVKFIIIDPKKIELTAYKKLLHHFLAVSPDIDENIITSPENAVAILKSLELEMEKRYDRLAAAGVRNIQDYNDRVKAGRLKDTETVKHKKIPFLVLVIDELADLMITAAREVEEPIARLAQLARAVGIHLVLATQRPSVDVITGVIKANFPARIAYQVASKTDSRTILDMNGAEQLLGSGDMLYLPSGSPKPTRIQNAFISSEEVERITDHIDRQPGFSKPFPLPSIVERKTGGSKGTSDTRDEFFEEAARLVVRHQQGSVSLIQRRLKVGYSRAARIIDELEAAGIVGPFDGSKARLVLIDSEDQVDRILETLG
jgi:S-DNA-T family DNA segregation ATPase FtsK/SpoIIIE